MFLGLDAIDTVDERRARIEGAWQQTANLARSLAQHADDTFRAVDASIIGVAQRLQIDGVNAESLAALRRIIAARLQMFPAMADTIIVGGSGACLASGRPILPGDCDFAGTENFLHHWTDASVEPYLGAPIRGKASGVWVIPLSRRFNRADGSFAGMVVGVVSIQHVKEFYDTFQLGRNGAILLARTDRMQLVRRPLRDGDIGRDLSDSPLFRDLLPKSPIGSAELKSFNDSIVRLISYHPASNFPLIISVAFAKDEILAAWMADLRSRLIRTGVLVLVIGALGGWLAVQVRRQKRLERAHRDTAAAFRLLAENSTDLIVRVGADMTREYVSPSSRELLGYTPEELIGQRTDDILHPDDRALWDQAFGEASRQHTGDIMATYRVRRKDGRVIWVEVCRRSLASGDGFVVSTRDVTGRKTAEDKLASANRRLQLLADRDGLTGLANRRHLDEALDREFRRARREGTTLSVVMIDVDRFKAFNDRYGHPAGDRCLRDIAAAIQNVAVRPADVVARYGGEELVILLPNTLGVGATAIAERARAAVRALAIAHESSEAKIATISLGVASFSATDQFGLPVDLVAAADRALYEAKTGGRDRVCRASDAAVEQSVA